MASGSCQCGALRFDVALPSKWVAHCHCSMCRRAHGAAFVTWVGMDATRARIDDTRQTLRWYASSPGAERGFCSHCGTMLFFRSQRWPGELHIVRANFDARPGALIRHLDLRRPIFRKTAAYGHFGRSDADFTWEKTDKAAALKDAARGNAPAAAPKAGAGKAAPKRKPAKNGAPVEA